MTTQKNPLLLTVREVALVLRIHRPKVYDLIREGTIEGFKLGSDWRVKRDSVEKLVGEIPQEFFDKNSSKEEEEDSQLASASQEPVRARPLS